MAEAPQAVVFDIGRVLYAWDLRHLYRKLIADPAELEWFVGHVVTPEWHFQSDAGRPVAEMVPELKARFPEQSALIDAYVPRFLETLPYAVPGTHALVERLAARGVPLFALTNFGAEFFARFRPTAPIFGQFRDIVVSGDEKCVKPEPRIYEIAEARFGYRPEALFFTDDSPANVEGARARGWQAHLFTDAADLEAALAERGLLPA
ncbi:MAG: hydrolase [Sphingomonadales bacterium 32-68-7]|nr:MAG: hydrolase [Sphingomonadales bacterium 12-68-11]OYX08382.1 MAG: hydrolase [Sphingomonadales bacterium 32-68-7]